MRRIALFALLASTSLPCAAAAAPDTCAITDQIVTTSAKSGYRLFAEKTPRGPQPKLIDANDFKAAGWKSGGPSGELVNMFRASEPTSAFACASTRRKAEKLGKLVEVTPPDPIEGATYTLIYKPVVNRRGTEALVLVSHRGPGLSSYSRWDLYRRRAGKWAWVDSKVGPIG